MQLYIGKKCFFINWSSREGIHWRNDKTCKQLDLQIKYWNNSITGINDINDYAWFITSKNFLEFKIKKSSEILKRRLSLWENGQPDQLMSEGKTIQDRLQNNDRATTNKNKEALTFARLIEEGKVNKAIKFLEKTNNGGFLPFSVEMLQ